MLRPALDEEHANGERCGEGCAGEVDAIVAEASGALKRGPEQAVYDGAEEGCGEDGPKIAWQEQARALAGGADQVDGNH